MTKHTPKYLPPPGKLPPPPNRARDRLFFWLWAGPTLFSLVVSAVTFALLWQALGDVERLRAALSHPAPTANRSDARSSTATPTATPPHATDTAVPATAIPVAATESPRPCQQFAAPLLPPGACRAVVQFDGAALRRRPNGGAPASATLCKGQVVGVLGQDADENWYEVYAGLNIGWVIDVQLALDDPSCFIPVKPTPP